MTATLEVSVVILYDGPLMLVNRRPEGSYHGGWWEWPGGKRHEGESALDCARRELMEEIGFDQADLSEYCVESADYPGRRVRLTFFVGRKPEGAQARPDALEHRWLPPEEVRKLRFLEPNLPVLERLIDRPPFGADSGRSA
ncbi:MAG: hypothetical protein ICCCNLDF_00376 [Planctomycetes bacterium]|nr:hypothetical protein [Planctomycetota bacterium]